MRYVQQFHCSESDNASNLASSRVVNVGWGWSGGWRRGLAPLRLRLIEVRDKPWQL